MTQESYKLDLNINFDTKINEKQVSAEINYENVTFDQIVEIISNHQMQGHIITSFQWR